MISPAVPILMARIFGFLGQSLESLNERDEVARHIMYSEGVSWGKFVPESEGGRFAEVYADATTVWPLLIKGVLEEMSAPPQK